MDGWSGYQFEDIENKDGTVMKDIEIKTVLKKQKRFWKNNWIL